MRQVADLELRKYRDELKRESIFFVDEEQRQAWDGELSWSADVRTPCPSKTPSGLSWLRWGLILEERGGAGRCRR